MKILIDLQSLQTGSKYRGIGAYTNSFLTSFLDVNEQHEVMILLNGSFGDTVSSIREELFGVLPAKNIKVFNLPGDVAYADRRNLWRREVAEYFYEKFVFSLNPDFLLVSSFFEGFMDDAVTNIRGISKKIPVGVIFYDLIPYLNQAEYLGNEEYRQFYLSKIDELKCADHLFAISESSSSEAVDHLGFAVSDITNISASTREIFREVDLLNSDKVRISKNIGVEGKFLLYTGASDERKNIKGLIEAYSVLPFDIIDEYQLLIAGGMPLEHRVEFEAIVSSKCIPAGRVLFSGYVSDEDFVCLYSLCDLYVFPSWHEGFGLPVLEAMRCGAVVIGANTSSVPEVIGFSQALFDPFSTEDIRDAILKGLTDEQFRLDMLSNSKRHIKNFSWLESAKRALAVFRDKEWREPIRELVTAESVASGLEEFVPSKLPSLEIDRLAYAISLNHSGRKHKYVFIDLSELIKTDAKSGIQRVVKNIYRYMKDAFADSESFQIMPVYASNDAGFRCILDSSEVFSGVESLTKSDDFIDFHHGDIFLGLDYSPEVIPNNIESLREMHRYGVTIKFVVYDLLCLLMPHCFVEGSDLGFRRWLDVVSEFDGAICISETVSDELVAWLDESDKLSKSFSSTWFHLGSELDNKVSSFGVPEGGSIILSELESKLCFLVVGTIEPRKGHAQTLAAFEQLWARDEDIALVFVGKQGWLVDELAREMQSKSSEQSNFYWLQGVSDEFLLKIYDVSDCVIASSEGEGFGLPIIEAAQRELPIIARDIPVFQEVAGNGAFYFEGNSAFSMASSISKWRELYNRGEHPDSSVIKCLSWKDSAAMLIDRMELIDS